MTGDKALDMQDGTHTDIREGGITNKGQAINAKPLIYMVPVARLELAHP